MDFFLKTTFINPRNRHGNTRGLFQVPDNRPIQVLCTTTRLLETSCLDFWEPWLYIRASLVHGVKNITFSWNLEEIELIFSYKNLSCMVRSQIWLKTLNPKPLQTLQTNPTTIAGLHRSGAGIRNCNQTPHGSKLGIELITMIIQKIKYSIIIYISVMRAYEMKP
jgi:hypothetical protein